MKQEIIQSFLNDEKANYAIFGTDYQELSRLYDDLMAWLKQNKTFENWLVTESAMHPDGRIRFDRQVTINNGGKSELINVVFKYFVYQYFYRKIKSYEPKTTNSELPEKWTMALHGKSRVLHQGR